MAHHAYLYVGQQDAGIAAVRAHAERELGLSGADNPDIAVFTFKGTFSVDEARAIVRFSQQAPVSGEHKLIAIATERMFDGAQNALLKTFEEPADGTTLVLIVPTEGIVLPTLRSRLIPFPKDTRGIAPEAETFLAASKDERAKQVTKLVARAKADKDAEKQAARLEAMRIVEGVLVRAHAARAEAGSKELDALVRALDRFMPIMHRSSAPLKLIFEHLLIVLPAKL